MSFLRHVDDFLMPVRNPDGSIVVTVTTIGGEEVPMIIWPETLVRLITAVEDLMDSIDE